MQEIGCLAGYTTKNTQICLTALCEIRGWNMDRILTYQIGPSEEGYGLTVSPGAGRPRQNSPS